MFNPKIDQNSQNTSRLVDSFKREFQKRLDVAKNTKLNQFSYENRIRFEKTFFLPKQEKNIFYSDFYVNNNYHGKIVTSVVVLFFKHICQILSVNLQ